MDLNSLEMATVGHLEVKQHVTAVKCMILWGFGGVLHCKGFLRVKLAASS